MTETHSAVSSGLMGVGYEGRSADELVAELLAAGVSRLVDVRLNPISRKRGLSKSALAMSLGVAGIAYEHRRELGNPKENRAGFAGSATESAEARAVFRALLDRPESQDALQALVQAGQRERVAVLCFEADQHRCHREVVLHEANRRMASLAASRFPAR